MEVSEDILYNLLHRAACSKAISAAKMDRILAEWYNEGTSTKEPEPFSPDRFWDDRDTGLAMTSSTSMAIGLVYKFAWIEMDWIQRARRLCDDPALDRGEDGKVPVDIELKVKDALET